VAIKDRLAEFLFNLWVMIAGRLFQRFLLMLRAPTLIAANNGPNSPVTDSDLTQVVATTSAPSAPPPSPKVKIESLLFLNSSFSFQSAFVKV
jgi:hypothetical protein